jgi:hypothetical protein
MSIALGLVSKTGAVVATDSLRVENDGSLKLDFDKTFNISDWFIGASVGLLEYSGRTVAQHVAGALGRKGRSIEACNQQLSRYFRETLAAVDSTEVDFQHRCLDLLIVVRPRESTSWFGFRRLKSDRTKTA